jgi:hypothetical protein
MSVKKIVEDWYKKTSPSKDRIEKIIKKIEEIMLVVRNKLVKDILEYVRNLWKEYSSKLLYVEE